MDSQIKQGSKHENKPKRKMPWFLYVSEAPASSSRRRGGGGGRGEGGAGGGSEEAVVFQHVTSVVHVVKSVLLRQVSTGTHIFTYYAYLSIF